MQIYGIDVSNGHLDIYSQNVEDQIFMKRITNKVGAINRFLGRIGKDSVLCAEHTGVYADLLVGLARASGIKIALVEGYAIHKGFAAEKGKSDRLDSRRIWEYATRFHDKLRFVEPPGETLHELRELQNLRNLLVKQRKMVQTADKGKQKQLINSLKCNGIQQKVLDTLDGQIKELEKEMRAVIKQDPEFQRNYDLARSVTGIGDVIATELILYTMNFTKIKEAKKAASFAGVCPYPHESGSIGRRPKVPKRSNKKLKSLLFMAALNICNFNKEFKLYRERKIAEGKHFFLVMNNIANKLLRIVFAVVRSGKPYDLNHICTDPRKT